ncbi:hypothetical protein SAMN05216431_101168 [Ligilactobacillus sp. WC1T17]|uniref:Uncharacterized protein n=1 Tax=Ligilactobacillus ruminis TaxID=1623 RepID=A0ABY1A972_9LACO|nr:hypothetical protein SAMN05216431_101168 [Ligilactobacillus ruminis]
MNSKNETNFVGKYANLFLGIVLWFSFILLTAIIIFQLFKDASHISSQVYMFDLFSLTATGLWTIYFGPGKKADGVAAKIKGKMNNAWTILWMIVAILAIIAQIIRFIK